MYKATASGQSGSQNDLTEKPFETYDIQINVCCSLVTACSRFLFSLLLMN